MKTKLPLLIFLFSSLFVSAQWIQRTNFPGTPRAKAASFTINNKVYVIGGITNASVVLHDVWEYDIASDAWTQKPQFPGPERYGAATFVINDKGYLATGGNDFGYLDDLWMYDPISGIWSQKNGLPVGSAQHENQRREAYAFSIGGKGYLGGGDGFVFGANGTTNYAFYDLWEYNPVNNSWTSKADLPDFLGRNMSVGIALNNKGYVGLGCDVWQSTNHTSFWEYDPVANSWTSKASFPSNFTVDAAAFALDSTVYVAGGVNINTIVLSGQVVAFNPSANTWTALPAFNGGAIAGQVTAVSGAQALMGTGYNSGIVARSDWWEFSSPTGFTEDVTAAEGISVYPVPMSSRLHIRTGSGISYVELFDVSGQRVMRQSSGFDDIDVSELSPGIFLLAVHFDSGGIVHRQLIRTN